jgi:ribosome maturation factor RimP
VDKEVTGVAVTDLAKRVEDILEPIAEQHGFELVAV